MEIYYPDDPYPWPTPDEEQARELMEEAAYFRKRADSAADSLESVADSFILTARRQRQYRSIEEERSQLAACRPVLLERSSPGTQ